jgi:hypothetical protein
MQSFWGPTTSFRSPLLPRPGIPAASAVAISYDCTHLQQTLYTFTAASVLAVAFTALSRLSQKTHQFCPAVMSSGGKQFGAQTAPNWPDCNIPTALQTVFFCCRCCCWCCPAVMSWAGPVFGAQTLQRRGRCTAAMGTFPLWMMTGRWSAACLMVA